MHRVAIHNFQSHKDTVLELSPTVNSLEGVSDSGKSAVLRAMLWCLTNKPDGVAFASNWAKDKKGKLNAEVSVSIDNITRSRNATVNGYAKFVAGKGPLTYEALKGTVPPGIENAINIGSVNIQRQMDPPFLLSSTPGDAARYVNELIGLEEIDTYQKALKGKAHGNANSLKDETKRLADAEATLSQYDWVVGAKEKVAALSYADAKCTGLEADLAKLSKLDALNEVSAELKAAEALEKKVTKLISSYPDTEKLESEVAVLKQADEADALTAQLIKSKTVASTADDKIIALSQINTAVLEADLALLGDSLAKDKGICNELFPAINMMPKLEELIKDGVSVAEQIEAATNDVAAIDAVTSLNIKIAESHAELHRVSDFLKGKACPVCGRPL